MQPATRYSELVERDGYQVSVTDLQDQLKYHKLVRKATGFTVTQPNRKAYVLQLQALLTEAHGMAANDLPEGESGIEGRGLKKRKAVSNGGSKKRGKKQQKLSNDCGDTWDEDEEFEV